MILPSTHSKLIAKNAIIFRVDYPSFEIAGCKISAHHEHFADKNGAAKAATRYPDTTGTITIVRATDFNPIYDR